MVRLWSSRATVKTRRMPIKALAPWEDGQWEARHRGRAGSVVRVVIHESRRYTEKAAATALFSEHDLIIQCHKVAFPAVFAYPMPCVRECLSRNHPVRTSGVVMEV